MDQVKDEKGEDSAWMQEIAINESNPEIIRTRTGNNKNEIFEGKTQMEVAQEIDFAGSGFEVEKAALIQMRQDMHR